MAQLLVVEDDDRIRGAVVRALRERGHVLSSAAAGLAHRLGAAPLLARAEALTAAPDGDPRLTGREREVAALVAQGLTNAAIARRLVLSERTVENHVAHVLHKLNLSTRTALAVSAHQGPDGSSSPDP